MKRYAPGSRQMAELCTALILVALSLPCLAEKLPRPNHVVVVVEENRSYQQIMDPSNARSYIHELAKRGMLFTQSHGVTHPSQPNYLALFSGSTQGRDDNACAMQYQGNNLASALISKGLSFASYSESLPAAGDTSCMSGGYQRKHNPAVNWQGTRLSASVNLRMDDFPQDFSKLPAVSFVIPDQNNDMHDGSFQTADEWLRTHIKPYVDWAFKHNSLLILTWDEGNYMGSNHIVTILAGPMIKPGVNDQQINHYNVLHTLLEFYDLPQMGESINAKPLNWNRR